MQPQEVIREVTKVFDEVNVLYAPLRTYAEAYKALEAEMETVKASFSYDCTLFRQRLDVLRLAAVAMKVLRDLGL